MEEVKGPRNQRNNKSSALKKRYAIIFSLSTAILIVVIFSLVYSLLSNNGNANQETLSSNNSAPPLGQDSSNEGQASPDNEGTMSGGAEEPSDMPDPSASEQPSTSPEPDATDAETSEPSDEPTASIEAVVPTPTPAPTEKPKSESSGTNTANTKPASIKLPTTYTVQKGDTLSAISNKFYGSKNHVSIIAEANNMSFINEMKAGDKLTIPALRSSSGGKQQASADYSKIPLPATYLIQSSDTLSSISMKFYKSKQYVAYLAEHNNLAKDALLKAGSLLTIPSLDGYKAENTEPDQNDNGNPTSEATTEHVVQKGETLYSISKKYYGTNKHAMFIADYNHLVDVDNLKAGTVLKIPQAK